MTGFPSTEETGERLGSVLLSLSQEFSLLPTPPLPRITSPRPRSSHLLPPDSPGADIQGYEWWASTKRTDLLLPLWTAVGQRLLMALTWRRPQGVHRAQRPFSSLSLCFLKVEANSLLHVETDEGEGKETGEQRQHKRQYREKKKKIMKYNTRHIKSGYTVEMMHQNYLLVLLPFSWENDRSVHSLKNLLRRNHSKKDNTTHMISHFFSLLTKHWTIFYQWLNLIKINTLKADDLMLSYLWQSFCTASYLL